MPPARRIARAVAVFAMLASMLTGCVTTVSGNASFQTPSLGTSSSASPTTDQTAQNKEQCAAALKTAQAFLPSWKALANGGTNPTTDQRAALAAEIQTGIDGINAQLPALGDTTLVGHLQLLVAEMNTLVSGLNSGIGVDLNAYYAALKTVQDYCQA